MHLSIETGFRSRFIPDPTDRKAFLEAVDRLPSDIMIDCGAKLYPLMNLTWGYVETIISLCREKRLSETKSLSRKIRELKREYDQFRASDMGDKETALEQEAGEWFEETFCSDFDKLFASIDNEACKRHGDDGLRLLSVSVHQTLTLIEAVLRYASECDQRIRENGVWTCSYSMVQTSFLLMTEEIRKFPTAKEPEFKPLREISAKILVNRLHQCEVSIEGEGKIFISNTKTAKK